jgi:uridylate kinase
MGGVAPAQTTDAVSAALAEYVNAELIVYATSVPGVFSSDPSVDESAIRYDTLSASDLVSTIAELEMNAGSNAPVDLLAAKIIQRAEIEAIVLEGSDPDRISAAIRTGEFDGTRIVPTEDSSPQQNLREFDR